MTLHYSVIKSYARAAQDPVLDVFCYAALLWRREAPTQRMLSQLVPNYSPSSHFHNTEQGSLYCFNNDSHAQKLFWLTSCIHHQYAFVIEGHRIFCTIINLL